jgi:DNA-binding MarR family transcriptional regulator
VANARTSTTAKRTPASIRPTKDEVQLFSRVRRATLILDALQRESLEELDLSFVEYSALRVLDLAGPPFQLSPSRMAEILVRTTGGMTKIVDRLERRGFVTRLRDRSDRRSVLVALTDEGKAMGRKANAAYRVAQRRVLSQLDRDDVAAINEHLDLLLEAFEGARIDEPEG